MLSIGKYCNYYYYCNQLPNDIVFLNYLNFHSDIFQYTIENSVRSWILSGKWSIQCFFVSKVTDKCSMTNNFIRYSLMTMICSTFCLFIIWTASLYIHTAYIYDIFRLGLVTTHIYIYISIIIHVCIQIICLCMFVGVDWVCLKNIYRFC